MLVDFLVKKEALIGNQRACREPAEQFRTKAQGVKEKQQKARTRRAFQNGLVAGAGFEPAAFRL